MSIQPQSPSTASGSARGRRHAPADAARLAARPVRPLRAAPAAIAAVPPAREIAGQLADYIAEQRQSRARRSGEHAGRHAMPADRAAWATDIPGSAPSASSGANPRRLSGDGRRRGPVVGADDRRRPSSSGWCISGPTISRSRPTSCRSCPWPACSSSRRSARTCSAASPTCCSRSSSIRRCCSISTRRSRSGPNCEAGQFDRRARGRPEARAQRESGARNPGAAHARRPHAATRQADVTEFARALTGWTVTASAAARRRGCIGGDGTTGEFAFAELLHEPGDADDHRAAATAQDGRGAGPRDLLDLAANPATARHICDQARAPFRRRRSAAGAGRAADAGVSCGAAATCRPSIARSIDSPEAWAAQPPSSRRRGTGRSRRSARSGTTEQSGAGQSPALLNQLGQPMWQPGSPAGFDDIAASWAAPDALMRRVEVGAADRRAGRLDRSMPRALPTKLLPGALSAGDRAPRSPAPKARRRASRCCSSAPNS